MFPVSRLLRLVVVLFVFFSGVFVGATFSSTTRATARGGGAPARGARAPVSPALRLDTIERVARDRSASVVFLHTLERPAAPAGSQSAADEREEALGSGVVIDNRGLILTNAHVIRDAETIHVRTPDGDDIPAVVVGADPVTDLALVRASDPTGLAAAPLGDSDRAIVGQWVVAIGNPYGLHHTVTAGIVSAKARQIDDDGIELLQTDASINPGNSGGALLNLNGEVIGITSALISKKGESVGLNFAIPINTAKEMLPQLRAGTVTHAWIGISTQPLGRRQAIAAGLALPLEGLRVASVAAGSPGERAGMRSGDVLLGVSGEPLIKGSDIPRRIRNGQPGTTVRLRVFREGHRLELPVTLAQFPPKPTT